MSTIFRRTCNYSNSTLQECASYLFPFCIFVHKMILQIRNVSKLNASWSKCRVRRSYEKNSFLVDKTSYLIYCVNFYFSVRSGKSVCEKNNSQYFWCVFSIKKKWPYPCFLFAHAYLSCWFRLFQNDNELGTVNITTSSIVTIHVFF